MKVCQVFKYYYPELGGIEAHVQRVAEGLANDGTATSVVSTQPRGLGSRTTLNGVSIRKTSSVGELLSVPFAPTHPIWVRRVAKDADVVHLHLPDPLSVVSYLAADPDPDVLVATYHSDIIRQELALKFYEPVLRRFLERTDQIIASSPRMLEHSEFLPDYLHKCTVVPFGIDIDEFESVDDPGIDLPGDNDAPIVLFVGRLVYYKGVDYLIDAMQDVDARLFVVGDGKERSALERTASDHGVDDRVYFFGEVADDFLHFLYSSADVFALPSCAPSEAFAIVQLEAMAHETPVVNTDLPSGVPWVSRDGETGVTVPIADADALADAINDLLDNPDYRRRLGQAGRRRVEEGFTTEIMLDRVREVYRRLHCSSG
jgi:rhamnosyl/mannosyltransferase